jgi:plastocyanin
MALLGAALLVFSFGCIGSLTRESSEQGDVGGAAPSPPAIAPGAAPPGIPGASPIPGPGAVASPVTENGPSFTVNMMTGEHRYSPATLDVPVGARVTWHNASQVPHTVTADPSHPAQAALVALPEGADPFDSGPVQPNENFSTTLTQSGEYRYYCTLHWSQGMVATITVGATGPVPGQ